MKSEIWSTFWALFLPCIFIILWIVIVPSIVTDILRGFRIPFSIYLLILFFAMTSPITILALWIERRRSHRKKRFKDG